MPHLGHLRCVPTSNGLIESRSTLEHLVHVGDIADIPTTDILVEGSLPLEGSTHIGDGRGVPVANVPVGLYGVEASFENQSSTAVLNEIITQHWL